MTVFPVINTRQGINTFLYLLSRYVRPVMDPVRTQGQIEKAARKAVEALYGTDIRNLKIRSLFSLPNEQKRESWDAQVVFLLNNVQYAVDLTIQEKDGLITNARLIDTMNPL